MDALSRWCDVARGFYRLLEHGQSRDVPVSMGLPPAHGEARVRNHGASTLSTHSPLHSPGSKGHATIATGAAQRNPWCYRSDANRPGGANESAILAYWTTFVQGMRAPLRGGMVGPRRVPRVALRCTRGYLCKPLRGKSKSRSTPDQRRINARSMPGQSQINAKATPTQRQIDADQCAMNTPLRALRENFLCATPMGLRAGI
jgi:hypothetical protein